MDRADRGSADRPGPRGERPRPLSPGPTSGTSRTCRGWSCRPSCPRPRSRLSVLAGTARPAQAELDLAQLARLLFFSAGVVRTAESKGPGAGSSSARPGRPGAPPVRGLRRRAARATAFRQECTGTTPRSTRCSRSARRPARGARDRPHRRPLADRLALPRARLPAHLLGHRDAPLTAARRRVFGRAGRASLPRVSRTRDGRTRRRRRRPRVRDRGRLARPRRRPLEPTGEAERRVDVEPLEFPLVTAAQRAGGPRAWGSPWPAGEPVDGPARADR